MSRTIAIFLSATLLILGVFGFLGFRATAGSSCGFACPLTEGVLAFSATFAHSLGGSTFVVLLLAFALALVVSFALPSLLPKKDDRIREDAFGPEEALLQIFKKITFWFSLHEVSPTK